MLLFCGEGVRMLNASLAWTLIPHCLLICTKDLQMDESEGGRRLRGKVITRWCKAGACRGFATTVQNKMKYSFQFCPTFFLQAASFPSISPLSRFINVILDIICIMYVWDLHAWAGFGPVSSSDIVNLTHRAAEPCVWPRRCELPMCLNVLKITNCSSPLLESDLFFKWGCKIF